MWQFLRELPLTVLRAIADLLEWLLVASWQPLIEQEDEPRSFFRSMIRFPIRLVAAGFGLAARAVAFPVSALFLPPARRNRYLRGVPAMLGVMTFLGTLLVHAYFHERILNRYVWKVQSAFGDGRVAGVQFLCERLVLDAMRDKPERVFLYSIVRRENGDGEAYEAILNGLAPPDDYGYPEAHFARALDLARKTNLNALGKEEADALYWHLTHCDESDNPQMHSLWALYYRAKQEWEQAESRLRAASRINPMYLLPLADFLQERGNKDESERVLNEAIKTIATKLNENPLSKSLRLELVVVLNRLKRVDDAEKVLVTGVQLHRDEEMKQALSDFYVMLYEEDREAEQPIRVQLERLMLALRAQPNSPRVYQACTECFLRIPLSQDRDLLQQALGELMVDGGSIAVSHFFMGAQRIVRTWPPSGLSSASIDLGNDRLREPDAALSEASWHLKQAIALEKGFAGVSNNYARVLLLGKETSPFAASMLAAFAVEGDSGIALYWDTLGDSLEASGDIPKSMEAFAEAWRLEPTADRKEKLDRARRNGAAIPRMTNGG
jgi:tetratricopeptide (TPR) repeat protein